MYVGISAALKKEIVAHITRMQEAQLDRVTKTTHPFPSGLTGPEWASMIERKAWGNPLMLKDKLPGDWLRPHQAVDVHFACGEKTLSVSYNGLIIDFPPTFEQRYAPDVTFEMEDLEPELAEKIERHFRLVEETGERYQKTTDEVLKLLDRCKSLNEAVALFPDLRYFLSESIKAKLDAKRKGEEEDKRLEGIDTALITSAIVVEQLHPEDK